MIIPVTDTVKWAIVMKFIMEEGSAIDPEQSHVDYMKEKYDIYIVDDTNAIHVPDTVFTMIVLKNEE